MRPLSSKARRKAPVFERLDDLGGDAAAEINAAAGDEEKRCIARETAEPGDENGERFRGECIAPGEPADGDLAWGERRDALPLHGSDRLVEIGQAGAGQRALDGDALPASPELLDQGKFMGVMRGKQDMPAFARHRHPILARGDKGADADTGARPEHELRRVRNGRAAADLASRRARGGRGGRRRSRPGNDR